MLILITSGQGPEECELAVSMFVTVLKKELKNVNILGSEKGRFNNCCRSVLLHAEGGEAIPEGTVQWISKSPFRPKTKRQNWFIGVRQLPEPEEAEYEITNGDIIFQLFKSGGNGGQHVNKTESGVRAVHLPSGISTVSVSQRSQFQNKKEALAGLKQKLSEAREQDLCGFKQSVFLSHRQLERGAAVRVYEGTSFARKK